MLLSAALALLHSSGQLRFPAIPVCFLCLLASCVFVGCCVYVGIFFARVFVCPSVYVLFVICLLHWFNGFFVLLFAQLLFVVCCLSVSSPVVSVFVCASVCLFCLLVRLFVCMLICLVVCVCVGGYPFYVEKGSHKEQPPNTGSPTFPSISTYLSNLRYPLVGGLDWWFGFGFESLVLVRKWEANPFHHQGLVKQPTSSHGSICLRSVGYSQVSVQWVVSPGLRAPLT